MSVHSLTPRKVRITEREREAIRAEAHARGVTTTEVIDEAIRELAAAVRGDCPIELPDHATPRASVRVSLSGWRLLQELPDQSDDRTVIRASATDLLSAAITGLARQIEAGNHANGDARLSLSA